MSHIVNAEIVEKKYRTLILPYKVAMTYDTEIPVKIGQRDEDAIGKPAAHLYYDSWFILVSVSLSSKASSISKGDRMNVASGE
jgi:hypothetical protein